MVWRPTDAGPRNLRELYHWVRRELVSVGLEVGSDEPGPGPDPDPTHTHNHANLTNVQPDQHHNQVHLLHGTDHSDVNSVGAPQQQHLLAYNGSQFAKDYRTKGKPYVNGNEYYEQDMVYVDGYLSIANKQTDDYPAPTLVGEASYIYDGAAPDAPILAKQIIFGNRYTAPADVAYELSRLRVYTVTGNVYRVFSVADPLGTPLASEIALFTATVDGWFELNYPATIVADGAAFDLMAIVTEPDPTPTVITADWDYDTPNNAAVPGTGVISHANRLLDSFRVNKTPSAGGPVDLSVLTVGDIIEGAGVRWAIQAITDNGTWWDFTVAPAQQGSPDGVQTFNFETTVATPITRMEDVGYWTANSPSPDGGTVEGLYIEDGNYNDIVPNGNAYGTDVFIQRLQQSDDWDLFGLPGSGGGGGGGGLEPHTLNYHDDVSISSPAAGQHFMYKDDGQWTNVTQNPLAEKPAGEPIFIVLMGQSNVPGSIEIPDGGLTPGLVTSNPRVFNWNSQGADQIIPGNFSWVVRDPYGTLESDFNAFSALNYCGMPQGNRAGLAWVIGDYLQKQTGRDVYIYQHGHAGTAIVEWQAGGSARGAIEPLLAAARATPEIGGRAADIVLWMQGEGDMRLGVGNYVDAWTEIKEDWFETDGNAIANQTMWMVFDISEAYDDRVIPRVETGRQHVRAAAEFNSEYVMNTSSDGIVTSDGIHYVADAFLEFGLRGAYQLERFPVRSMEANYWAPNGPALVALPATSYTMHRFEAEARLNLRRAGDAIPVGSDNLGAVRFQGIEPAQSENTVAEVQVRAGENWVGGAHGSGMYFRTTLNGTTAMQDSMWIAGNGRLFVQDLVGTDTAPLEVTSGGRIRRSSAATINTVPVTTTDNTWTEIDRGPITGNARAIIDVTAIRQGVNDLWACSALVIAGIGLVDFDLYTEVGPNQLDFRARLDGADIVFEVRGQNGQTWIWVSERRELQLI